MARISTQLVIEGKNNSKAAFDQVNSQLEGMNKKLVVAGKALAGAFSVSLLAGAVRSIAETSDSYNLMNARLKLATGSQQEFNVANDELRRIAKATQTPLESMVTLYGRISRPLKEAGRSQADILKVTEAVAQSFRISGATAEEAQNGVVQFAQALGSGALRGDEFNSVAEQAPRLMQALAAGIGVPVGALKEMAAQGLLTAQVVTDALTGQLDVLRTEAQSLPATVGGAMTELSDTWNAAIGSTDTQPLIDAIKELAKTVSDPAVVEGLSAIAGALLRITSLLAQGAAEFAGFAKYLAYSTAKVTGQLSELDRAEQEIKMYQTAIDGIGVADLFHSDKDLKKNLDAWKAYRAKILEEMTGMNADMKLVADLAAKAADDARQAEIDAQTKYIGELKTLQDKLLSDAQKAIKEQESLQKKAIAAKAKLADDRKAIDAKYDETKAQLNGAGGKADTYGDAQSLKVNARNALQSGDSATAIKQAEAARQALLDLQAAGGSTYGLAGFADELRAIELAAKDLEASEADRKIAVIGLNIAALTAQAADLKDIKVTPTMDDAAAATLTAALQALAASLSQTLTIPVRVVPVYPEGVKPAANGAAPAVSGRDPDVPPAGGFAKGTNNAPPGLHWVGEDGPELMSFRGGEQVIPAGASARLASTLAGMQLPRGSSPALVDAAMSAPVGQAGRDLGRVELNIGGQTHSLLAEAGSFDQLRMASLKFGRTKKN